MSSRMVVLRDERGRDDDGMNAIAATGHEAARSIKEAEVELQGGKARHVSPKYTAHASN